MGPILGVYDAFRRLPVPVLTLVQGRALGFGCAMVGASDVAIAAASARFALPEMKHGIPPTLAISALVPRVAAKTVADLVYSAEEIDASSAFRSEEHTSELQSLMRISFAVFCLKKKT